MKRMAFTSSGDWLKMCPTKLCKRCEECVLLSKGDLLAYLKADFHTEMVYANGRLLRMRVRPDKARKFQCGCLSGCVYNFMRVRVAFHMDPPGPSQDRHVGGPMLPSVDAAGYKSLTKMVWEDANGSGKPQRQRRPRPPS